jgi:hypothetical protein
VVDHWLRPLVGAYSASKFALEGMSECLAREVSRARHPVTIVEPSDFRTGFRDACRKRAAPLAACEEAFAENLAALSARHSGDEAGDPARAAQALLALVASPDPPLRLGLGNMAFDNVTAAYRRRLEEIGLRSRPRGPPTAERGAAACALQWRGGSDASARYSSRAAASPSSRLRSEKDSSTAWIASAGRPKPLVITG